MIEMKGERENTESNVFRVEHDEDGGEKHDGRTLTDPSRRFSSFSPFFTIYSETREKGSHPSKKNKAIEQIVNERVNKSDSDCDSLSLV